MPPVMQQAYADAPELTAPARAPQPQSTGFLSGLLKRNDAMPEPELVQSPDAADTAAPTEDRVSARITDAIRNRVAPVVAPTLTGVRIEPKLTAGRGPQPLIMQDRAIPTPPEDDVALIDDDAVIDTPAAAPQILHRARAPEVDVPAAPEVAAPIPPAPAVKKVVQHNTPSPHHRNRPVQRHSQNYSSKISMRIMKTRRWRCFHHPIRSNGIICPMRRLRKTII